jgi:hypothetical protein
VRDRRNERMSTEAQIEVYRTVREAQGRYTYFLLAAAGAGIALSVNETHGAALAWSQVPLGLAVLSWGLSFFCGCRYLNHAGSVLYANFELLRVQAGEHPEVGQNKAMMVAAAEGIRLGVADLAKKTGIYANRQFRLLVCGAVLYVVWHVLEMHLKAVNGTGVPAPSFYSVSVLVENFR